jgi:hypothetical protein
MKGGSVASSAVVSNVTEATFSKLDKQFDGLFGGAKPAAKKPTSKPVKKTPKTPKTQKTPKKPAKTGGSGSSKCNMCGGQLKKLNDMEDSLTSVQNKKGGGNPMFQIKYDYASAMQQSAHGAPIDRTINETALSIAASDSISSLGNLQKTVAYGNVFDKSAIPFTYNGGKASKTQKTSKPKNVPQKKSTKTSKK